MLACYLAPQHDSEATAHEKRGKEHGGEFGIVYPAQYKWGDKKRVWYKYAPTDIWLIYIYSIKALPFEPPWRTANVRGLHLFLHISTFSQLNNHPYLFYNGSESTCCSFKHKQLLIAI